MTSYLLTLPGIVTSPPPPPHGAESPLLRPDDVIILFLDYAPTPLRPDDVIIFDGVTYLIYATKKFINSTNKRLIRSLPHYSKFTK